MTVSIHKSDIQFKQSQRDDINAQINDFFAKGGEIKNVDSSKRKEDSKTHKKSWSGKCKEA